MRCHVPFAHRNRPPGPIYIGFEQPVSIQRRKGKFNWAGFWGLMLALISPITLFLIAPVALLLSLIGLRRAPRGMATVGTVLALGGTTVLSLCLIGAVREHSHREHLRQQSIVAAENRVLIEQTRETLDLAADEVREFRSDNDNYLPEIQEGMLMTVKFQDGWEQELFYEPVVDGSVIRSAGPDGEFHSSDDLTVDIAGLAGPAPIN